MATHVVGGLRKASEAVQHTTSKDKKIVDLQHDTVSISDKLSMTTDHGVKIENTDQWLRVVDDIHTGPSLLEDQLAREKVCQNSINSTAPGLWIKILIPTRSPVSTTNVSRSESFMLEGQARLETSNCTSPLSIFHLPVFSQIQAGIRLFLCGSLLYKEAEEAPTLCGMYADSLSSSTPTKATGISWAITSPYSSSKTLSSFLILVSYNI